jgi:hypothetical protein
LKIVDDEHHRAPPRHAPEKVAQFGERPAAGLLSAHRRARDRGHGRSAVEYGEEASQCPEIGYRHAQVCLDAAKPMGQGVHDAVECFERYELVFVAAARANERRVVDFCTELGEQSALSDARAPAKEHREGALAARGIERPMQLRELGTATYKETTVRALRAESAELGTPTIACVQPREHLGFGRPSSGVGLKQIHAETFEIGGHRGYPHGWALWSSCELRFEHLPPFVHKGQRSGERFVHHDSDRVPVGGELDVAAHLLRRHVRQRSTPNRRRIRRSRQVGNQSEVEENQATVRLHERVGWLDVAVDFACSVQRSEAIGELYQAAPEFHRIEAFGTNVLAEGHAVDLFHGEEPMPIFFEELTQLHQIGMMQILEGAKLFFE